MTVHCLDCVKVFSSQSTLNRHKRRVHKQTISIREYQDKKRFACIDCVLYFAVNEELRIHLQQKHQFEIEKVFLEFDKLTDFNEWKLSEEKQNNVKYIKTTGTKRCKDTEKIYYECVRSSRNYKIKVDRKRALKSEKSYKKPYSCTSQILLQHNIISDKCQVNYIKTHYGHTEDVEHLRISKTDDQDKKRFTCIDCVLYFTVNEDLRTHLQQNHQFEIEKVFLEFDKLTDFNEWKLSEEKQNYVQYIKTTGTKRCKDTEKIYYECVRSSQNYKIKVDRKRAPKSQKSCKMPYSCTSQILLQHNIISDKCQVNYIKTHYGHTEDVEQLRISKTDEVNIASKLILGVPSKGYFNVNSSPTNPNQLEQMDETKPIVNHISKNCNDDYVREQIKLKALDIIANVDKEDISTEQLNLTLELLTAAANIQNIAMSEENQFAPTTEVEKEPHNKNILKQVSFFSTKTHLKKSEPEDLTLIKDDIILSRSAENDHLYC